MSGAGARGSATRPGHTASGTPGRTRVGCGTLCTVSDAPQDAGPDPVDDLEALVGSWLTIPDIAERLGLPLASVRKLVEDRELLAHRVGERRVVAVPAGFVDDEGPLHALKGTFTVLADGGMSDTEILRWLHTPDDTLPGARLAARRHPRRASRPRCAAAPWKWPSSATNFPARCEDLHLRTTSERVRR